MIIHENPSVSAHYLFHSQLKQDPTEKLIYMSCKLIERF